MLCTYFPYSGMVVSLHPFADQFLVVVPLKHSADCEKTVRELFFSPLELCLLNVATPGGMVSKGLT